MTDEHASILLYRLLDACDREGRAHPHGTREIRVDEALAEWLRFRVRVSERDPLIPFEVIAGAFVGLPVKTARNTVRTTIAKIRTIEERDRFLRNYARKHNPERAA